MGRQSKRHVEPEINRRRYALAVTNTATINHLAAVIPSISIHPRRDPLYKLFSSVYRASFFLTLGIKFVSETGRIPCHRLFPSSTRLKEARLPVIKFHV